MSVRHSIILKPESWTCPILGMVLPNPSLQPFTQQLITHLALAIPNLMQGIDRDERRVHNGVSLTLEQKVMGDALGYVSPYHVLKSGVPATRSKVSSQLGSGVLLLVRVAAVAPPAQTYSRFHSIAIWHLEDEELLGRSTCGYPVITGDADATGFEKWTHSIPGELLSFQALRPPELTE
ncbi:TPA: hypothetical protein ACG5DM_000838 [Pseudomonas putida]|uniref:hypothetical protein n=1 Tax=Pseudomonas TaxID=286 RepID=UPI00209C2BD2|nr:MULTISPECIES: hypothetical protein [Pseudomonas]MDH1930448.1 hypothetical protein [Pseudomonas sp. GD03696]